MALKDLTRLADVDRAYFAGIMDGEGCVTIARAKKGKWSYYTLFLSMACTDPSLMIWIIEKFGGRVAPRTKCKTNRKDVWVWRVASREAEAVLRQIEPFMVVKRDQARLALAFRDSYSWGRPNVQNHLPIDIAKFRNECFDQIKHMKHDPVSGEIRMALAEVS